MRGCGTPLTSLTFAWRFVEASMVVAVQMALEQPDAPELVDRRGAIRRVAGRPPQPVSMPRSRSRCEAALERRRRWRTMHDLLHREGLAAPVAVPELVQTGSDLSVRRGLEQLVDELHDLRRASCGCATSAAACRRRQALVRPPRQRTWTSICRTADQRHVLDQQAEHALALDGAGSWRRSRRAGSRAPAPTMRLRAGSSSSVRSASCWRSCSSLQGIELTQPRRSSRLPARRPPSRLSGSTLSVAPARQLGLVAGALQAAPGAAPSACSMRWRSPAARPAPPRLPPAPPSRSSNAPIACIDRRALAPTGTACRR